MFSQQERQRLISLPTTYIIDGYELSGIAHDIYRQNLPLHGKLPNGRRRLLERYGKKIVTEEKAPIPQVKEKDSPREKPSCNKCQKKFTAITLKKHNGVCGRCAKLSGLKTTSKNKIPKSMKRHIWMKWNGNVKDGICFSCQRILYDDNFHAGHVKSEFEGGVISVENMRPICGPCNLSCSVINLDAFKKMIN